MQADIKNFRMPRSAEVASIGLYLDQTTKYINEVFRPLGCVEVTPSMISNYVKKKYIGKPIKKLYSREQIICLMFIALAKLVLSMDNIDMFLKTDPFPMDGDEYDSFCDSFENILGSVFGFGKLTAADVSPESEKERFAVSLMTAIAHYIYLNDCFEHMSAKR